MARKTRLQRKSKYQSLMEGVKRHWSGSEPRTFARKTYSIDQIMRQLQSMLDSIDQTAATRAAWLAQVAKQRILESKLRDFVRLLEIAVRGEFGDGVELADFGLEPAKKTGPRTVAVKLEMVKKMRATRVERNTMGKRQRQKIKGKP
jgi:uncharacterized protein YukE